MNAINYAASKISGAVAFTLDVGAKIIEKSDALEKAVKIADRIIAMAEVIMGALSVAFSNLSKQLKDTIIVFETLKFIGAVNTLISPTKSGKSFFAENSWQKSVDRVSLAFHSLFKMIKGLNRFGFVDYGVMAKNAIGKLPIFTLVMDSFMLSSSFFGTWDTVIKALPKAREEQDKANKKLEKWEYRSTAIDLLKIEDSVVCKQFETRYKQRDSELKEKLAKIEGKQPNLSEMLEKFEANPNLPKESRDKILAAYKIEAIKLAAEKAAIEAKIAKVDHRMTMIANNNFKGLAEDLQKVDIKFRMDKWKVVSINGGREEIKAWSAIANSVGKIAVILFAFTLTALNLWTAPFLLSLLAMGNVVDLIGLTKILLPEYLKPLPVPVQVVA